MYVDFVQVKMAKYVTLFLVFFLAEVDCNTAFGSKQKRQTTTLKQLDNTLIQSIDKEARKQIMFLIADRLNDSVSLQSTFIKNCEMKINQSIKTCSVCKQQQCTSPGSSTVPEALLNKLSTEMYAPITYAGEVVKDIAEWTVGAKDFLGDRWGQFTKNIGSNFIEIGNIFAIGGQGIFSSAVNIFKSLGDKFESAGGKIIGSVGSGIGSTVDEIRSIIGNPFSNFDNTLNNIKKTLSDGASTVSDTAKNAASTVWDNTFGRLFRRKRANALNSLRIKRCTSSCPSCENFDVDLQNSVDQIVHTVCGNDTTQQKTDIMDEITFLKDLYNRTRKEQLITLIEFDILSAMPDSEQQVYTESFFTMDGKRMQLVAGLLNMSSPEQTGESMAQQFFATQLANRKTNSPT